MKNLKLLHVGMYIRSTPQAFYEDVQLLPFDARNNTRFIYTMGGAYIHGRHPSYIQIISLVHNYRYYLSPGIRYVIPSL